MHRYRKAFVALVMAVFLSIAPLPLYGQTTGTVFKDCDDCPEIVVIPPGSFMMGSEVPKQDPFNNEKKWSPPANETPQHRVTIEYTFAIGKYEVTQAQWFAVMGNNPSTIKEQTLPVTDVGFKDVLEFMKRLSTKTGKRYSLPSEAVCEYSARAGSTTLYSSGDSVDELGNYAWYCKVQNKHCDPGRIQPVGGKLPNQFGLYDMHGNVWEYVLDCYKDRYVGAPADGSAVRGVGRYLGGCDHVARGGSFYNNPAAQRSAFRNRQSPTGKSDNIGFRVFRRLP